VTEHTSFALKITPYAVAFLLTVLELPSRLIAFRHRESAHPTKIEFAIRWNKVAEAIGYPIVVFFIALSHIYEMVDRLRGIHPAWWIAAGLVYVGLLLMTYWLFAADLEKKTSLPALTFGTFELLGFDSLVALTKTAGVLFPAALDIWVSTALQKA